MTPIIDDLPQICLKEQLDCVACTGSTARELAKACPGLPGRLVAQLFVQIHPHASCARMHRNFSKSYTESTGDMTPALAIAVAV